MASLKVPKMPTSKHDIVRRKLMTERVVPDFPEITLFAGPAGSGKTNLVVHLLSDEKYYGKSWENLQIYDKKGELLKHVKQKGFFDHVILLIGSNDDMYDALKREGIVNHIIVDPTPAHIQHIIDSQQAVITRDGIEHAPKVLIIGEDILGNQPLIKSKPFRDLSIKNRHLNFSVWYLSQYVKLIPMVIREQATTVVVFRPTAECSDILCDMYREPKMDKKTFMAILHEGTVNEDENERNFLYIDKKAVPERRYRKNLIESFLGTEERTPIPIDIHRDDIKKIYRDGKRKETAIVAELPPMLGEQVAPPSVVLQSEPNEKRRMYMVRGQRVYI